MANLISHKTLDKMVNYESGGWCFYYGVNYLNVNDIILKLKNDNIDFKHYLVSTAIKGLYDDVIIIKKVKKGIDYEISG